MSGFRFGERQRISDAYSKVVINENIQNDIDSEYGKSIASAKSNYEISDNELKKLDAELAKARLMGEKDKVKELSSRITELRKTVQNNKNAYDDIVLKRNSDYNNRWNDKNEKMQFRASAKTAADELRKNLRGTDDIGSTYDKFANNGGSIGALADGIAKATGLGVGDAIDQYSRIRNGSKTVPGTRLSIVSKVDNNALSSAKKNAETGNYGAALDDIAKDYAGQFDMDYNTATNNVAYQNVKSRLNSGKLPSREDIDNALGAMNSTMQDGTNNGVMFDY